MSIFMNRSWDSHNSNTLIYMTQLFYLGKKKKTKLTISLLQAVRIMEPLDFEHEKLEYDTRKVLERKWLLTRFHLWGMRNISTVLDT